MQFHDQAFGGVRQIDYNEGGGGRGTKKQDLWDVEIVDKHILIGLNDVVQLHHGVTWDE